MLSLLLLSRWESRQQSKLIPGGPGLSAKTHRHLRASIGRKIGEQHQAWSLLPYIQEQFRSDMRNINPQLFGKDFLALFLEVRFDPEQGT